jgi:hypothetical protein
VNVPRYVKKKIELDSETRHLLVGTTKKALEVDEFHSS